MYQENAQKVEMLKNHSWLQSTRSQAVKTIEDYSLIQQRLQKGDFLLLQEAMQFLQSQTDNYSTMLDHPGENGSFNDILVPYSYLLVQKAEQSKLTVLLNQFTVYFIPLTLSLRNLMSVVDEPSPPEQSSQPLNIQMESEQLQPKAVVTTIGEELSTENKQSVESFDQESVVQHPKKQIKSIQSRTISLGFLQEYTFVTIDYKITKQYNALCDLCQEPSDNILGPIYELSVCSVIYTAHDLCLLWSSQVELFKKKHHFKIKSLQNVIKDMSQRCFICKNPGATLYCQDGECQRDYHFKCFVLNDDGSNTDIEDKLISCMDHKIEAPSPSPRKIIKQSIYDSNTLNDQQHFRCSRNKFEVHD